METFNLMGNTQREQWHTVVTILRTYSRLMDSSESQRGFLGLCDEIDRYIDWAEDIADIVKEGKIDVHV